METNKSDKNFYLPVSILAAAILISFAWIYTAGLKTAANQTDSKNTESKTASVESLVLPEKGVILPVKWNDLGKQMIETGVIDLQKLKALYANRGGLSEKELTLLESKSGGNLVINSRNSGFLLNLFWALGLANQNPILSEGQMQNPRYGGAGRFASTGGWTLSRGNSMDHYAKHDFFALSDNQQKLVEKISQNIYRPCCNNPTSFPDCNHGMAMLGLLELMASQNIAEKDMYDIALKVNSFWFPDAYLAIAKYFENRGVSWNEISSKEVLGSAYSSIGGYRQILSEIKPDPVRGGSGCAV